jgi:hypothetical protein
LLNKVNLLSLLLAKLGRRIFPIREPEALVTLSLIQAPWIQETGEMMRPVFQIRSFATRTASVALCLSLAWHVVGQGQTGSTRSISELSWISGDWQTGPGGRAQVEEHWTAVAGASMMGMSRTVVGEKTAEFEYLRIEQRPDGNIYYVAHPKARCPGTDFKLTRASASEAVFENPEHDFPKRIIYRKTADDALTASIDGGEGTKSMSFAFKKMK